MPDQSSNLLALPANAGRAIVESGAMLCCPLLGTSRFVSYCTERGLAVTHKRLLLLERLGRFAPVFRVKSPPGRAKAFHIPVRDGNNWFERRWAWDTTAIGQSYEVPPLSSRTREAYYSVFQIDQLDFVLRQHTISVQLDWELERKTPADWNERAKKWLEITQMSPEGWRAEEFRRALNLLCQFISERYYPHTQSDQRRMQAGRGSYSDAWIVAFSRDDWWSDAQAWDPQSAAKLFSLTPEKLRHAYEALAVTQEFADPLANWHQLVQFVAVDQRKRLKGDALQAETLRSGALMLRSLYRDLYEEELPLPNEVTGTIITHIPELEVRRDTRRFLEFVTNRFHLNPQPVAAVIVEGPTEQRAIEIIFDKYVGSHPGKYGIEIIVLGGVDAATGAKEDRFRAILRLIDYLHHHQTITLLLLDNERYARKLYAEARNAKSIHHTRRYVTRPEYVKIWQRSFEFDNYSCAEIAKALGKLADGKARFSQGEIEACKREVEHGAALKRLYLRKAGTKLDKMRLTELLVETMLSPKSRRKITRRPIIKALDGLARLASRNPLPTMQEIWEMNQTSRYLGKRRGRTKTRTRR